VTIEWIPREPPLPPAAAVAFDDAARALAKRLLAMTDEQLARIQGAAAENAIVIAGDDLPWVDGIQYAGRDPNADGLLLPTHVKPNVPADLFAQAILHAHGEARRPLVVIGRHVIPMGGARTIDRAALERWLRVIPSVSEGPGRAGTADAPLGMTKEP